ncbi:ABC transporter ATP-binding protein [Streptomyces cellulosae]|uniref:ABC transporter ATP-binding protein n=1 Tax=Streptomyces cellulosae TaxID=1968 RepID=A0ABW7Y871_STRCE
MPADGSEIRPDDREILLDVRGLTVEYVAQQGSVRACDDVSFTVRRGEILGVAGESGSGKSTLITALTRLERPPAVTTAGEILFRPGGRAPVDLVGRTERELRGLRWRHMAVVLQSAMNALNPVMRLGAQFRDVLSEHDRTMSRQDAQKRTEDLLALVGLTPLQAGRYPHELSGGTRQRATIALALACGADLVVMDEPTTAVDVVMQRQILANVLRLRAQLGFAVVFVTHDLSLLVELADCIAIMYAGRIVEIGSAFDIYHHPKHPYTEGLRASFPPLREPVRRLSGIPGSPPDLRQPPPGCAFHPRCPRRFERCDGTVPDLRPVGGQSVACLLYGEGERAGSRGPQGVRVEADDVVGH